MMLKRYSILCVLMCWTLSAMGQHSLPGDAGHLREYRNDERSMIDAARQYHLQHMDLSQWDFELAQDKTKAEQREMHQERMQEHIKSVRMVWEYVLSLFPNNVRALNYFGEYLYDVGGNIPAALTSWNRALVLDRDMSLVHNNLGIHYFQNGDYRNGLRHVEKAVELDPKNPDFLFNITQMYLNHFPAIIKLKSTTKKKLYRDAMKHSLNASRYLPEDITLAQDYAVNFFAGENFGVDVDWAKAAEAWQVVQGLAVKERHIYYSTLNEGRSWLNDKDYNKALPVLEAALALMPGNAVAERLVAQAKTGLDQK